jgi:hypothetical protein
MQKINNLPGYFSRYQQHSPLQMVPLGTLGSVTTNEIMSADIDNHLPQNNPHILQ